MKLIPAALLLSIVAPSAAGQAWLDAPRELIQTDGEFLAGVADVDGDGRLDFLVKQATISINGIAGFYVLLGTGPYTYSPGAIVAASPVGFEAEQYMIAGDVTGDGRPDVVTSLREVSGAPGFGFLVYVNQGGGTFAAPIHTPLPGLPKGAAFSDWNNDGIDELVTTTTVVTPGMPFVTSLRRWTWNGAGFTPSNESIHPDFLEVISVGDVTADGVDDVVAGAAASELVHLYPSLANGDFAAPVSFGDRPASSATVAPTAPTSTGTATRTSSWPGTAPVCSTSRSPCSRTTAPADSPWDRCSRSARRPGSTGAARPTSRIGTTTATSTRS